MADRATSLSIWALIVALTGFVWWNLQPDAVSLVGVGPGGCEVTGRGPGWPISSYTRHAKWSRPDVPITEVFQTPDDEATTWERRAAGDPQVRPLGDAHVALADRGRWNRWVLNSLVGGLLVAALVANVARACRDARRAGNADLYHRYIGYTVLASVSVVLIAGAAAVAQWMPSH
ncbi:MAG TPA: hypothetical protein VGE74_15910 [Gemmata sp.]